MQPRVSGFLSASLTLFILFLSLAVVYHVPVFSLCRQLEEISVLHHVLVKGVCVATGILGLGVFNKKYF